MVASIANRRTVDSSQSAAGGEGRASFGWGLAGFLSLVPLANWSAWLVAAQLEEEEQGESSPVVCYAFAVLYALPILHNGIVPDVTDAVMLALGALHLQVERVAQSEPSALHALPNLQNGGGKLFSTVTKTASSTVINLGKKLETRQSLGESDNEATSDELEEYTEAELKAFDDKLRQSSSAKTGEARRKPSSGTMIIEDSRERERDDA